MFAISDKTKEIHFFRFVVRIAISEVYDSQKECLCDNVSNSNRWNQFVVNEEKEEAIWLHYNDDA